MSGNGCVWWRDIFFFNGTATTVIYTLSLHDALPIFFYGSNIEFINATIFYFFYDFFMWISFNCIQYFSRKIFIKPVTSCLDRVFPYTVN